jgi:4-hydroxy-tetrahydrodipicolinate reductase
MVDRLRVAVTGVAGRMGKALREAIAARDDMVLAAAVERQGHELMGQKLDGVRVRDWVEEALGEVDVVIDFSTSDATARYADQAAAEGVPFVSGTTGLDDRARAALRRAAERIPVLWAPNMSVGVNLLFRLVELAARALGPEYDPEIIEIHHRYKVDAPSGTAMRLAEILRDVRQANLIFGREGAPGVRPRNEVGVHAVRAGDIVGDHTVLFAAQGERLELTHRVHSRSTLAEGALRAAKALTTRPPGLYSMADVLDL